ncbi:hypothetical protein U1Q18_020799 [Sarracenia purpurea var. burkii]
MSLTPTPVTSSAIAWIFSSKSRIFFGFFTPIEVCPSLLIKKDRGCPIDPKARPKAFRETNVATNVPGLELLQHDAGDDGAEAGCGGDGKYSNQYGFGSSSEDDQDVDVVGVHRNNNDDGGSDDDDNDDEDANIETTSDDDKMQGCIFCFKLNICLENILVYLLIYSGLYLLKLYFLIVSCE